MDTKNIKEDNRQLKQQLAIAQDELKTIKNSKAFSTIRIIGHAKDQFKKSPTVFIKKTINKLTNGTIKSKGLALHKNLISKDDLQSQHENWIILNEPDEVEFESQKTISESFVKKPLISIITPVFNPPVDVFRELIESVLAQTYYNFELCLGDFGNDESIAKMIKDYAGKDSRIKSMPFSDNKGIAENSNKILAKVKGEYIALLDHDDTLSKDALFENVKLLNEGEYDFIYSDKDKIDELGNRFEPFFKPGWSPEIMLNANYLTHLNVMKTSLVRKVGAWDSKTDGAQDWDLFLKVIAASKSVGHIQKVLYHWRVIATSTAMSIETKPYALEGQRRAVDKYLLKNKIPAKSYHIGAELLLKWDDIKKNTVCIVRSHSNTNLRSFLNNLLLNNSLDAGVKFIVMHGYSLGEDIVKHDDVSYVEYKKDSYIDSLKTILKANLGNYVLSFDDRLNFDLTNDDVRSLSGWLDINSVVAVGPRIVDIEGYAINCFAMITDKGVKPLFVSSPPYHQAALGNIEWVRNSVLLNNFVFISSADDLLKAVVRLNGSLISDDDINFALQLSLSEFGRLVFNPKVVVKKLKYSSIETAEQYEEIDNLIIKLDISDPYTNQNLSGDNPMLLTDIVHSGEADSISIADCEYQLESRVHAATRTLDIDSMNKNTDIILSENQKTLTNIHNMVIFLPDFNGIYAGLNNIFSYANSLHKKGTKVIFAVMTSDSVLDRQRGLIIEKFAQLGEKSELISVNDDNLYLLPKVDVAVCTQWATAYLLAKFNKTSRKCYFIQDKEASFYPKGTISALVENTYKFGFFALANTPGLLDWYEKEYNGKGIVIKSKVDLAKYSANKVLNIEPKAPYKVFFYARPNEPRNAFELGAASLTKLKDKLGDKVEIFAAGAEWNTEDYGLDGVLVNLGKINYDKLPGFYRSMDAGMMFMYSGHPGVVASELMASGCPVVVNEYSDVTWYDLYQDEKTCLVSISTADEVARSIERCLTDSSLREVIIKGGLKKVKDFYDSYDESIDTAYNRLLGKIE